MKLRKCVSDNLDYLHGAELGLLGQAEVGDGAGGGACVLASSIRRNHNHKP